MLQRVDVGDRSLESYRGIALEPTLEELTRRARELQGARVLHLNATPYGGGVSELLRSLVPLLCDLGVEAEWKVMSGDEEFFRVTKKLHNALQGASAELTDREKDVYLETSRANAERLHGEYDFVVVHDPQPAGMLHFTDPGDARWIWRCHIDTSEPQPAAWALLQEQLDGYDAAIFTMAQFVPPAMPIPRLEIVPPAIDPLSPKNLELPDHTTRQVLDWIGIDPGRPLITQVSRFDPWKDPFGVIAAYRMVCEELSGLQLALVGSMALDDPEAWELYRELQAVSAADPLVHVFTNLTGVGNVEVNAFQRHSDVVVQKSIREGFGLVVSEALWKRTPVVAGRAGGIPLQMADGVGGVLVDSVEDCAAAIAGLFADPARARLLGESGRRRVQSHFLLPRLLLNELSLMLDLAGELPLTCSAPIGPARRDPVCGMALGEGAIAQAIGIDGHVYRFCSDECMRRSGRPRPLSPGDRGDGMNERLSLLGPPAGVDGSDSLRDGAGV